MRPLERFCEVWRQQQDQWTHVETIPCGLFPGGDSGLMWFPAGGCPPRGDRLKEPDGATWWEVTGIDAVSADTAQVTVRRCRGASGLRSAD